MIEYRNVYDRVFVLGDSHPTKLSADQQADDDRIAVLRIVTRRGTVRVKVLPVKAGKKGGGK